jgi:MoaA/NifB/PqqE/SkfB family radical SAM enzyme
MNFVPADHEATVRNIGSGGTASLIAKAAFGYRRTISYFLRRGQFLDLRNFFYTKTILPTGEGAGELAYYAIGPLLQQFPQLVPYPRYLEIEITSKCNKVCIMCEHTWWHEPSRELSFEEYKHLVDQFNLYWVTLAGEGDPFLNKDILKMIEYSRKKHMSVYMDDSLDLVDESIAYELVRLGVEGIYVSMDAGTKETYESLKVGCNFDRTIKHLKGLLAAKKSLNSPLPEICFRFVVNKKNQYEMSQMIENIQKLGKRSDFGDGSKINFVGLLSYPETKDLLVEVFPQTEVEKAMKTSRDIPIIFARSDVSINPSINRCLAFMEPYCVLVPENIIIPCCAVMMSNSRQKLLEYCFGNYNNEPTKDIWSSAYYKWFRQSVTNPKAPVPELCAGCRAFDTKDRMRLYGVDKRKRSDFE